METRRGAENIQEHIFVTRKFINKFCIMLILPSSSLCISTTEFISLCTTTVECFVINVFYLLKSLCFKMLLHFWIQEVHFYFTGVSRKFRFGQKDSTDFKKFKIVAIKLWTISSSISLYRSLLCICYVATLIDCPLTSASFHVNCYWFGFRDHSKHKKI